MDAQEHAQDQGEKTKFIIFVNPEPAKFVTKASITLSGAVVRATGNVCGFGVLMNTHLDGSNQISAVVRSCNYHLHRIAQVRQYSSDACKLAVLFLIVSRLDYCSGLLAGATERLHDKLQRIQI